MKSRKQIKDMVEKYERLLDKAGSKVQREIYSNVILTLKWVLGKRKKRKR